MNKPRKWRAWAVVSAEDGDTGLVSDGRVLAQTVFDNKHNAQLWRKGVDGWRVVRVEIREVPPRRRTKR